MSSTSTSKEADKTSIRDHVVRDLHSREKLTGHRIGENKPFFEDVAKVIADAGAILIVGPAQEKDLFAKFLAEKRSLAEIVEELYLATLSRRPTAAEQANCRDGLAEASDAKSYYEDLLWSLINSKQFLFIR